MIIFVLSPGYTWYSSYLCGTI